jgi:hypothetical protein
LSVAKWAGYKQVFQCLPAGVAQLAAATDMRTDQRPFLHPVRLFADRAAVLSSGEVAVQLLPVCWADEVGVLLVLQQSPFILQLFDQPCEVGRFQLWSGDSGDAGDNLRRFWPGTWQQSSDCRGDTR